MSVVDIEFGQKKSCGSCTKCCEGWLLFTVNSIQIHPNKPCYMLKKGVGCTDYENRPEKPCKSFKCAWLMIDDMPEEFKPDRCGVIMNYNFNGQYGWFVLTRSPNNPTAEFLQWAIKYANDKKQNIVWSIDSKTFWLGTNDFCKYMESLFPNG